MYPFASPMMMGATGAVLASTTWSATDKSDDWALSADRRTASRPNAGATGSAARATKFISAGKAYAEIKVNATGGLIFFGLSNSSYGVNSGTPGNDAGSIRYNGDGSVIRTNSVNQASNKAAVPDGSVMGLALDRDAGTIGWYVNGVLQFTSTTIPSGPLAPIIANSSPAGTSVTLNCGQEPFAYPIPSGFSPWG